MKLIKEERRIFYMKNKSKIIRYMTYILVLVCLVIGLAGCGSEKKADAEEKTQEKEIIITEEIQHDMNFFLSKFLEFRMYEYNNDTQDYDLLSFAHTFIEYNYFKRVDYIEDGDNFYTSISLEDVNTALKYFFGKEVHPEENKKIRPKDAEEDYIYCIYKDGNILFPSATGDESAVAAVVNKVVETKENRFKVQFDVYGVDNIEEIDYYNWSQVYDFNAKEVEENLGLSKRNTGSAVVEKVKDDEGEHYRLVKLQVK